MRVHNDGYNYILQDAHYKSGICRIRKMERSITGMAFNLHAMNGHSVFKLTASEGSCKIRAFMI